MRRPTTGDRGRRSAFRGHVRSDAADAFGQAVGGHKAYDLARQCCARRRCEPVPVTVQALERHRTPGRPGAPARDRERRVLRPGARARPGRALGCGAHLLALRRTAAGPFDVADALPLGEAERLGRDVAAHVISPAAALAAPARGPGERRRPQTGRPRQPARAGTPRGPVRAAPRHAAARSGCWPPTASWWRSRIHAAALCIRPSSSDNIDRCGGRERRPQCNGDPVPHPGALWIVRGGHLC